MPTRRWTDGAEDSMQRAFDLLREEMRTGFDGVNRRLDVMNGRVNDHGEDIATLRQGCLANNDLAREVHNLSQAFASHRARCPYDGMNEATTATTAANTRWTNAQLAGGVAGGSVLAAILVQVLQWVVQLLP